MKDTHTIARAFTRLIRWSAEDSCYIGSLPEIAPDCCHAPTIAEVSALLDDIAELSLKNCLEHGIPYDAPGSALVLTPHPAKNADTAAMVTTLRRRYGLSQADFSAALGISKSTLSKWETGDRRPDGAAHKLLRILQTTPELISA